MERFVVGNGMALIGYVAETGKRIVYCNIEELRTFVS